MYKLIGTFGKVNKSEIERLITDVYNNFNGVINPNNVSLELKFIKKKIKMKLFANAIAFAHYNSIEINSNYFTGFGNGVICLMMAKFNRKKANDMMATLLIDVTLHELSHLQQDFTKYIEFKFLSLDKVINFDKLEISNAWRTRAFIEDHRNEIYSKFDVDINYDLTNIIIEYYKNNPHYDFYEIENPANSVLTLITGFGLDALNKESIEKLNINKVGLIFENKFYNIYDPIGIYAIDSIVRYSFKKFDVNIPQIVKLPNGEFVIASTLKVTGELNKNIKRTEEFRYCAQI